MSRFSVYDDDLIPEEVEEEDSDHDGELEGEGDEGDGEGVVEVVWAGDDGSEKWKIRKEKEKSFSPEWEDPTGEACEPEGEESPRGHEAVFLQRKVDEDVKWLELDVFYHHFCDEWKLCYCIDCLPPI